MNMTTMTMEKQKVIVNNPWNTERKEFPYLNTLEDMEASELFEEFQESGSPHMCRRVPHSRKRERLQPFS